MQHNERAYRDAIKRCVIRYKRMASSDYHTGYTKIRRLEKFVAEMESKVDTLPIPKLCRWLGFIQGVLIERGQTTVTVERNWTRPLFGPLDSEKK